MTGATRRLGRTGRAPLLVLQELRAVGGTADLGHLRHALLRGGLLGSGETLDDHLRRTLRVMAARGAITLTEDSDGESVVRLVEERTAR